MDYQKINLLFRHGKQFSHETIRANDLSDTECMICSFIYSNTGCSQDDVAGALLIDKATVAKALQSLENKGCVSRVMDADDKRKKRLSLTEAGQQRMVSLIDLHNNWLAEIMTALTPKEQLKFETYCERLLAAAAELGEKHKNGDLR